MKTETWIDKGAWPRGPWDGEPDRAEWTDDATGLQCLALRNHRLGHWCGYVALQEGHPLHGKGTSDDAFDELRGAHGGVTFAEGCMEDARPLRERVCHATDEDGGGVWWVGFDCAHAGDAAPNLAAMRGAYRDLAYVRSCCATLAASLAALSR